jgi:hypothetical protein
MHGDSQCPVFLNMPWLHEGVSANARLLCENSTFGEYLIL